MNRSNYGVRTTSRVEWAFVVDDKATPEQQGLSRWPAESEDKLSAADKRRRRKPSIAELLKIADGGRNQQLKKANHPPLVEAELIAANLYTGPVCRPAPCPPAPSATMSCLPPWAHFHIGGFACLPSFPLDNHLLRAADVR